MVERNGIGKFSGGKWGNVKLLAMLVGLGESILATASSYEKTSPLQSEEQQWPLQTCHTKASPTTTFPGKMSCKTYR